MRTILRYAGGKTKAIKKITPFVKNYDKIVSPFIGGGSLEVEWSGNLKKEVIGYDIFDILTNFWNVVLNNPNELADELSKIEPTTKEFNRIKEILMCNEKTQNLLKNWQTDYYKRENIITLDPIVEAAYYYFHHNCSYGPAYLAWGSSVYLKEERWAKMINELRNFKCQNLKVSQMTFDKSIPKHNEDFLYLDPPYYLEKDSDNKMFKGMYPQKNIPVHHDGFNHQLLRDLLLNHKGDFVMSYNNCETIRDWYKDFEFYFPEWSYSMGNGEQRIGATRKLSGSIVKDSHEILIVKKS